MYEISDTNHVIGGMSSINWRSSVEGECGKVQWYWQDMFIHKVTGFKENLPQILMNGCAL